MSFLKDDKGRLVVIALGGNAILRKGGKNDIHEQFSNTRRTMVPIVELLKKRIGK